MSNYLPTAGAVPVRNKKGELRMEKVKVSRYVAGQRPEYAGSDDESSESSEGDESESESDKEQSKTQGVVQDRRIQRMMQQKQQASDEEEDDEIEHRRPVRRRRHEPEVIASEDKGLDTESKGDIVVEVTRRRELDTQDDGMNRNLDRRQRLREEAKKREEEEARKRALNKAVALDESEDGSSSYEEYTDSDENSEDDIVNIKPIFVRKKDRDTILTEEQVKQKEKEEREKIKIQKKKQKEKTIILVANQAKKDIEMGLSSDSEDNDSLSDGDGDEKEEFELWKIREMARLKRDKEKADASNKEKLETEERRNMTDQEIIKERGEKQQKGSQSFMQKYFHKGAFFVQDEKEDIYNRDFTHSTGDDYKDRSTLPKAMQVRNFGRSGSSKWTHMAAEDTTQQEALWEAMPNAENRLKKRMAGMKQDFYRPSARKK